MKKKETPKVCHWCDQDDPSEKYVWRQPYDFEPGEWVCEYCYDEMPWK